MTKEKSILVPSNKSTSSFPTLSEEFITGVNSILIDFSKVSFVNPFQLVYVACILEQCLQKNINFRFSIPNSTVEEYLVKIRFFDYWKNNFNRNRYTNYILPSSLCLWNISETMIDAYANHADKYYTENHFTNKDLTPLSTILKETFNNIFNHSKSKISGYTFSQYFPKNDTLQVSICDFGIGIPTAIKDYLKSENQETLSDEGAIIYALKKGTSSKSIPQNRGWGLNNIQSIVSEMNGKLTIRSNQGFYLYSASGLVTAKTKPFNGTLIDIELKTLQLDNKELEDDFDFF